MISFYSNSEYLISLCFLKGISYHEKISLCKRCINCKFNIFNKKSIFRRTPNPIRILSSKLDLALAGQNELSAKFDKLQAGVNRKLTATSITRLIGLVEFLCTPGGYIQKEDSTCRAITNPSIWSLFFSFNTNGQPNECEWGPGIPRKEEEKGPCR